VDRLRSFVFRIVYALKLTFGRMPIPYSIYVKRIAEARMERSKEEQAKMIAEHRVERLEKEVKRLQDQNQSTVRKLNAVTERLSTVPSHLYEDANRLKKLLKFILWQEEIMKELGFSGLIDYPVEANNGRLSDMLVYIDTAKVLAREIPSSMHWPNQELVTETAKFEAIVFTVAMGGGQFLINLPAEGPWDKMKLPFDGAEDRIRTDLRKV
jgi:hypothetical protein